MTIFQINTLSEEIYSSYFANKINHMRPVVARLKEILTDIDTAVMRHNDSKSVSLHSTRYISRYILRYILRYISCYIRCYISHYISQSAFNYTAAK